MFHKQGPKLNPAAHHMKPSFWLDRHHRRLPIRFVHPYKTAKGVPSTLETHVFEVPHWWEAMAPSWRHSSRLWQPQNTSAYSVLDPWLLSLPTQWHISARRRSISPGENQTGDCWGYHWHPYERSACIIWVSQKAFRRHPAAREAYSLKAQPVVWNSPCIIELALLPSPGRENAHHKAIIEQIQ